MGLFMGASLITVFELVVYLVVKLYSLAGKQRQAFKRNEGTDDATGNRSATAMYANSVYIWIVSTLQWPLLLTWFNFDPSMDK